MKCQVCKKSFKQDEQIVPVMKYIENEKRGGFVDNTRNVYVHLSHLITKDKNEALVF